jgi:hypothetical protein
MNKETGEIKEKLNELEDHPDDFYELSKKPDKKCKHCYGRGYIGWEAKSGNVIPCRCTRK